MVVKPARYEQQADRCAVERAQIPGREQDQDRREDDQGEARPTHARAPQTHANEEDRRRDEKSLEKLEAAEAQKLPDAPQDHLVEPFKFRSLMPSDGVGKGFDRAQLTRLHNLS